MSLFSSEKLADLIDSHKNRTGRRLTIRELAKETDISPAYLTLLKNGQRNNPSMDVVVKLSQYFQVPHEELMEETEGRSYENRNAIEPLIDSQAKRTLQVCEQLIQSGSPSQAMDLLALLAGSSEAQQPDFSTEIQLTKARALSVMNRYEDCLEIVDACLNRPIPPNQQSQALYIRGRIHYFRERFSQAIVDLLEAKDLADEGSEQELQYQIHYLLGICYKETFEYGASIYYFECAQRLFPEILPIIQKGHLLMGMGNTYLRLMSLEAAMNAYRNAETIYREVGDHKLIADIQHNIARVKMMEGDYEAAIHPLQESLRTHQLAGDHLGIAADLLEIAHCYKEMKRWDKVQEQAFRASVTFENGNKRGLTAQAQLLMIEATIELQQVPANVFDLIDGIIEVFTELEWHLFLAHACHIKATLLKADGKTDEALKLSMQALALYGKYSQPSQIAD